jgi:hypothetical protein
MIIFSMFCADKASRFWSRLSIHPRSDLIDDGCEKLLRCLSPLGYHRACVFVLQTLKIECGGLKYANGVAHYDAGYSDAVGHLTLLRLKLTGQRRAFR